MLIPYPTTKWSLLHCTAATIAIASLAACGGSNLPVSGPLGSAQTSPMSTHIVPASEFRFFTIDNPKDLTFNQLLGIDNAGEAAGHFGSGAASQPNRGYTTERPYTKFRPQNYPGSIQTQVTAINNVHMTGGFWIDASGVNRGYIFANRVYTNYAHPNAATVTRILGLNDQGHAVGFYTDASGINHGFELNYLIGKFTDITPPSASNVTATAINNAGDVVGFYIAREKIVSFLKKGNSYTTFEFPKSKQTMAFGVNDSLTIVGGYVNGLGRFIHGFRLERPLLTHPHWTSIDDPHGIGNTVINGLNDKGEMVGYYVSGAIGPTHGMLIKTKK